jgi:hypothetical protein
MAWLRPTRVTWALLALLLVLCTAAMTLLPALGVDEPAWLLLFLAIEPAFSLARTLGMNVGRRGDWFGYAFPNALGWTVIALVDAALLYLLASVGAAGWRVARGRTERGPRRGTMG